MIILRYLAKEVLQSTFAVTAVLLVIIMSGRFIKYLAEAATGKLDASVLLGIMFYRLPGFLELILPLGFFISILMAYGRLYTDSEMTVMFSCGLSRRRLIAMTYVPAILIAVIVACLSLWLTPMSLQKAEEILAEQQARNDFETMQPARFQLSGDRRSVSYTEKISDNRETLTAFFLANTGVGKNKPLEIIRSREASYLNDQQYGERYIILQHGVRHQGRPGQVNYRITEFEQYAQHVDAKKDIVVTRNHANRLPTMDLIGSDNLEYQAALQWRLASPLLILIVTVIGVVLSHTNPRRGRYVMLFPAILLYLIYLVLLNAARGSIEEGSLNPATGLWGIHSIFILLAIVITVDKKALRRKLSHMKSSVVAVGSC